jgi:hypothetical protein
MLRDLAAPDKAPLGKTPSCSLRSGTFSRGRPRDGAQWMAFGHALSLFSSAAGNAGGYFFNNLQYRLLPQLHDRDWQELLVHPFFKRDDDCFIIVSCWNHCQLQGRFLTRFLFYDKSVFIQIVYILHVKNLAVQKGADTHKWAVRSFGYFVLTGSSRTGALSIAKFKPL